MYSRAALSFFIVSPAASATTSSNLLPSKRLTLIRGITWSLPNIAFASCVWLSVNLSKPLTISSACSFVNCSITLPPPGKSSMSSGSWFNLLIVRSFCLKISLTFNASFMSILNSAAIFFASFNSVVNIFCFFVFAKTSVYSYNQSWYSIISPPCIL